MENKHFLIGGILVAVVVIGSSAAYHLVQQDRGQVGVIQLSGTITPTSASGFGATTGITPSKVRSLNDKADSKGVSAVIYEINSGGGAVVASKEVMREIESVDKPTVCRIRDIGASGAYLASLGCDRIVADSASLTGSIGVKASYLEFSGLLNKLGIEYVNLTAGRYKDAGSQYENLSEEERELLQSKINRVHEEFVTAVEENRNLSDEKVEQVRTGESFLGDRAKELELVDQTGGRSAAIRVAENMTGKELETVTVEDQPPLNLLSLLTASTNFPGITTSAPLKSTFR